MRSGLRAMTVLAAGMTLFTAALTSAEEFVVEDGDVAAMINAVNAANSNDEPDTIHLAENGHYLLEVPADTSWGGMGLPQITSEIIIEGNGATIERSSEDGTPNFRFFFLAGSTDADLTLVNLTLHNGQSSHGGAIRNWGHSVTLIGCTLSNNSTTGSNLGGAIHSNNGGDVTISGSTLIGNASHRGGAINKQSSGGSVIITDSVIVDNISTGGGTGGGGLFLESSGTHSITRTIISGNTATSHGGGLRTGSNHVAIIDCTVSGNSTGGSGGGIWNGGSLTMTGTTFSGNTAEQNGGGQYASNTTNATNCTFSGNSATNHGGGIFVQGTVNLTNCTVADNTAGDNGGGIYRSVTLNMSNSIVAYNTGGNDVHNGFTDLGYNIVEDGGGISEETSMSGDPMLGPLADNGGPTMTHALLPGSPALDAGDCAGGTVAVDQRGVERPQGNACDIGAFELDGIACPADFDGSNTVDVLDLLAMLSNWGPCADCPADLNGDEIINVLDLLALLSAWGPCE